MTDYIRELLAGELRRRAPHVVTNPEDFYVYCLADELAAEEKRRVRLNNERAVIVKGAEADITYSVELLDALGTDQWTEQLEHDAIEFLEEVLDQDVTTVTPELLAEARHARRRRREFQLARLEEEL